ncbi:hypothetical protein [Tumidithrix elongata]
MTTRLLARLEIEIGYGEAQNILEKSSSDTRNADVRSSICCSRF